MTPTSQHIALTEWSKLHGLTLDSEGRWMSPYGWIHYHPEFDLNAVHELEGRLDPNQQCTYITELEQVIRRPENISFGEKPEKKFPLNHFGRFHVAHATAAQRCEALLRTLGKWQDST